MKPRGRAHSPVYHTPVIVIIRAALRDGPLLRVTGGYRNGGRMFHTSSVNRLIASGEAVRIGNGVIAADMLRQAEAAQ